jgi:hypothetical protein
MRGERLNRLAKHPQSRKLLAPKVAHSFKKAQSHTSSKLTSDPRTATAMPYEKKDCTHRGATTGVRTR